MTIYDISMTISESIPVYKNNSEKHPKITNRANHEANGYHESSVAMDLHTGTHIDAPLHMVKDGKTMEVYEPERFINPCCRVLDLTEVEDHITKSDLEKFEIKEKEFLLFKTKNSFDKEFNFNFVYLDREGAAYLAGKKIDGVGIDALGIERAQDGHETHKLLLRQGIMIVEGLALKDIEPGLYSLIVLPVKIAGVEASPARALLIKPENALNERGCI